MNLLGRQDAQHGGDHEVTARAHVISPRSEAEAGFRRSP